MATTTRTGSCLCGGVTFEAECSSDDYGACHCGMCRKWSGSATMGVHPEKVTFTGEENITAYASSEWAERGFCKTCGTHLFYRMRDGSMTVVWAGTLDDQSGLKLAGEIYIDSKPDGYAFVGDHPRLTEHEFFKSIGMAE